MSEHVPEHRLPDGVFRPATSLQTLDAFHLDICCDRSGFPSHTSLLARNRWGHRGTSRDERRRVSQTDLFPAFAPRLCQLTQSRAHVLCQRRPKALSARHLRKRCCRTSDGGRRGWSDFMSHCLCNQSDVINNFSESSGPISRHMWRVTSSILETTSGWKYRMIFRVFHRLTCKGFVRIGPRAHLKCRDCSSRPLFGDKGFKESENDVNKLHSGIYSKSCMQKSNNNFAG